MENKAHAFAAGVFVLAVTALLVGMVMWLMRDTVSTSRYEMTTTDAVTGLQPQAAVRFKGVAVGKVTNIDFDPDKPGNVLVELAVDRNAPVTQSTFATLAFQGVTGLSFVQLDDDGSSSAAPVAGPNGVPRIPLKPNALGQLQDMASDLVEKVGRATDRVNQMLGPDNQAALSSALTELGAAAKSVNQLASHTDKTIQGIQLEGLIRQTSGTLATIDKAAAQVRVTAANLDTTVGELGQGVQRVTGPGGVVDRMSEGASTVTSTTLPRIQNLTEDASRTIRRLDRIANALSENPQAFIYGSGTVPPGPGEPGFQAPATAPGGP
ncbi:MlaD family protein [Ottowia oryzae]